MRETLSKKDTFGDLGIKHGIFLGPMAGVTDLPYRLLCQEQGCEMTFTEMVSAKGIYYNNKNTDELIAIDPQEKIVGLQLFGREPELMAEMAKRIDHPGITCFDVNMGCPVPKVVNNGEGSALMKEPLLIGKIVEALVKALDKPVSIKIRAGFDASKLNAPEIAYIAQESGASFVSVHGRTREQYYSGKANWDIIRRTKEAVEIPVIGNGDVTCGEDAKRLFEETACDGIMVGRAALGNPWIFKEIVAFLEGRKYEAPTLEEVYAMALRHGKMLTDFKGEYVAMREMRKHLSWYIKGRKHATKLRHEINQVDSLDGLLRLLTIDKD